MILTGKCKEKFFEIVNHNEFTFSLLNDLHQNALIIEFFDSIEYNKNSSLWDYCFFDCYWNKGLREYKQATIQAIKQANDLYNSRYENV